MKASSATTRIRRLQQALKESEARRQALLESSLDCVIFTDARGRITDLNSAAERTFRITRSETLGKDLAKLIFPEDLRDSHRWELFAKPKNSEVNVIGTRLETRAIRANGAEFPAEVTVTGFAEKGKASFTVTVRDVTARRKAEEALVRLAAIVESSQDAIIGFDFEGCITNWNRGAARTSGYSEGEAMGKSMLFLMPENRAFDYTRCIADLKARRSLVNFETVWVTKDGRHVDVSLTTSSILNSDGEMVGGSIIAHDITGRKLAEEALRKANEMSIYGSPIPVVAADDQGNVTMWNNAATEAFGWTEAEVKGKPNPIISPEELGNAMELHRRILEGGETLKGVEVRRQRRDGASIEVSLSATPLWNENGKVRGMIGFLTDITERKRAELALRQAEEKYRGIFENAVEGIYQAQVDGRFLSANPALARMLGFHSSADVLAAFSGGKTVDYVDPEKQKEFRSLMAGQGRVRGFQYQIRRSDGTALWVSENAHAVRNDTGEVLYYEGTVEDTTRQRELEEQLIQMQKIEAIGRLAGGVAHDFNNILMAISSYAELLCRKLPEADASRRYVDEIVRATDRGSSLTQGLLAFSRKQVLSPQIVDLNALVCEEIDMLERLLGESTILRFQAGAELGRTKVDPGQVQQVVMNLVINARDAMPEGGEIVIETANAELDPSKTDGSVATTSYVMLSVSDTGCGIDEKTKSHIFEPFFTTKEQGKGTGLGLATVFGIVKQSQGQIFVQSEPGMGSTFKVYFPRVEMIEQSDIVDQKPAPVAGHETILLVEDQAAIRESAAEYLSENGYTVLKARDGVEALEVVSQHTGMVHLLLTDVVMPQMSGKELSERFSAIFPKGRVVFMSGYSNNVLTNHQAVDHKYMLLQKPFRLSKLGQSVRQALGNGNGDDVAAD
jgi:two-component system, cell cycle sensor histidine kinase and response regulator CckA